MLKGNVLIVDDEPFILKLLCMNLEDYADKIFTASDGLVALDILKKENVHCVVCDVNMPRMTGLELIKKIRTDNNLVPFIFYTGHGNRELMLEVAQYGAFDFFKKPDFDGLEESLARGLKKGFHGVSAADDEVAFISEYQKTINEFAKNKTVL